MREIKFRVWDIKDKKFIDNPSNTDFWVNPLTFKTFVEWRPEYDGQLVFEPKEELFIFQQFTGLIDANGEEIYEGDVLELIPAYENMDLQYDHVKWNCDAWEVHGGYLSEFTNCLIVGNIFNE